MSIFSAARLSIFCEVYTSIITTVFFKNKGYQKFKEF